MKYLAEILGCRVEKGHFTYLGATIGASSNSIQFWEPLKTRVKQKLETWDARNLSMAGRLVLLKAAIDSLPTYWFSLHRALETVI